MSPTPYFQDSRPIKLPQFLSRGPTFVWETFGFYVEFRVYFKIQTFEIWYVFVSSSGHVHSSLNLDELDLTGIFSKIDHLAYG